MIQDIANHAPIGAQDSGTGSASTVGNWLSGSARSATTAICKLSIPNPAYYFFSAPGKAFTLLTLFARGVAGATVPNTYKDSWHQPQPIALPDMPQPPEPAWMAALDYQSQDEVLAREKRSGRGSSGRPSGGRSGGAGRSGGRGRSGGKSRSGGKGRSGGKSRSGGGKSSGSSIKTGWRNGRLWVNGHEAKDTGRTVKSGKDTYKVYTTSRQSYFVGKANIELRGQRVNLHKLLTVKESGQLKESITTSRGKQYKITSSGGWQKMTIGTGNSRFTISAFPKVRQHTIAKTMFRMAIFNIYFNPHMYNPVHAHFLFHNGQRQTLSCVPSPDNKNIDIGYYDDGSVQPTTASISTATAVSAASSTSAASTPTNSTPTKSTITPGLSGNSTQTPDSKFIKLASAPIGSSIKFAVLDNPDPKAKLTPTPTSVGATNSTTPALAANTTAPAMVSSTSADVSALVPYNTTDIDTSNNITQIDSLLAQADIAHDVMSQLAIMNGDEVLKIIHLDKRVLQYVIASENDTIANFPMIGPKTVEEEHTWYWKSESNAGVKNTDSLVLPVVAAISALKRYIL